jgi:hypothetical protein
VLSLPAPAPSVHSSDADSFADELAAAWNLPAADPDDAGPYEPPTPFDEAWHEGLVNGIEGEMPEPPAGYDAVCAELYRRAWDSGRRYQQAEFEAWLEAFEAGRDFERDPDPWNEARGCLAGHPAFEVECE